MKRYFSYLYKEISIFFLFGIWIVSAIGHDLPPKFYLLIILFLFIFINLRFGSEYKFIIFIFSSIIYLFIYNITIFIEYIGFPIDYSYLPAEFLSFFLVNSITEEYNFHTTYVIIILLLTSYLLLAITKNNNIKFFSLKGIITKIIPYATIIIFSPIIYSYLLGNRFFLPFGIYSKNSQATNLFLSFTAFYLAKYIYSHSRFYKTNKGFIIAVIDNNIYNLTEISHKYSSYKFFCENLQAATTFQDFLSNLTYNGFLSYINKEVKYFLNLFNIDKSSNENLAINELPIVKILRSYYPISYLNHLKLYHVSKEDFLKFQKALCKTKH